MSPAAVLPPAGRPKSRRASAAPEPEEEEQPATVSRMDVLEQKMDAIFGLLQGREEGTPSPPPVSVHSSGEEGEVVSDMVGHAQHSTVPSADVVSSLEASRPAVLRGFPMIAALLLHASPHAFFELDTFLRPNFPAVEAELQRATSRSDSSRARQLSTLVSTLEKRKINPSSQSEVIAALACWVAAIGWVHPELHGEAFNHLCYLTEINALHGAAHPTLVHDLDKALRWSWRTPGSLLACKDAVFAEVIGPRSYLAQSQPFRAPGQRQPSRKSAKPTGSAACFKYNSTDGCPKAADDCRFRHMCCSTMPKGGLCGAAHTTMVCDAPGATKCPGGPKRK